MSIANNKMIFPMNCGFTSKKGNVYIAGGTDDLSTHSSKTYEINVSSSTAIQLGELNEPRSENSLVVIGDFLVIAGGKNEKGYVSSVEFYDLKTKDKKWVKAQKELSQARSFPSMAACEKHGKVIIFGGIHEGTAVNAISIFDLPNKGVENNVISGLPNLHSAGVVCCEQSHDETDECTWKIFGGVNEEGKESETVFSYSNGKHFKEDDLCVPDTFYGKTSAVTKDGVMGIGCSYLHVLGKVPQAIPYYNWYPL